MRRREREAEHRAKEDVEFQARMAREIVRLFPGCPARRTEAIARHTGTRGSGRVGRSAVIASIRHLDTNYDSLLMSGLPRDLARERVRPDIDRVIAAWSKRAGARASHSVAVNDGSGS